MMNPLLRLTSLVLAVACAAGCTMQRINESMARTQSETDTASQYTAYLRNQQQEPKRNTVVFSKKPWVSTQPISAKRGLPMALDCELAYRPGDRVSITEIAQYITSECGLPVLVSPDALNPGLAAVTAPPASGAARPAGGDPDNLSDLLPAGVVGAAGQPASVSRGPSLTSFSSFGQTTQIANLTYKGKLSGLLDLATARLGLTWRYSPAERAVRISYVDTRVFEVWSFGDSQVIESVVKSGMTTNTGTSNGTSGGGGGGGSGSSSSGASGQSGSNQSTTVTLRSTILTDVKNNVQAMLSPAGRLYLSTSTGTLTVTDRPEVLARVEAYLNETNRKITQQVLFNVRVLEVTLTDQDQLGLNWDVVYKSLANKWGLSLVNTLSDISTNAISGSVGILDTAHSPWAGSNLIVKALAEQGRISTVREPSLTTLNLQPAPIQIGNVKGYIESSSTTTTASVGSNTALQAATITSGFNMTLLPRLLSQDEMLLMVSINMSSKPTFDVFQSNGSSAQTPDYDTKVLSPKIKLRSGQTLILSGFDESREDATKIGAGKPGFLGLGGSQSRTSTRSVLVVLITPIVTG
ncbi:PilN family type IVB pilus formation outer membrane protein [Azotobacter bryophylli]|uniref:PilN family type IVB pilus formation outer membrane protein n=1 Tax=Azotobacter bryophylli TaxID=1986537 RepID=A0ABV7AYU7_9GAMM